jgi:hypothetical protein
VYNIYLISSTINNDTCYKIGYTRRDPLLRISEIKTGNASELELIDTFSSKWGTQIEASLHRFFINKKINGEWFKLDDNDVKSFIEKCELYHSNFELLSKDNNWFKKTNIYKKFS